MKKQIKERVIDELVESLKNSPKTEHLKKQDKLSTSNNILKKTFDLLKTLPCKKLNGCVIIPLGRIMSAFSEYNFVDLNYFYFLTIKNNKINLYTSDLKEINSLREVQHNAAFSDKMKRNKLVFWISELQNHPDFIFEDLEKIKKLLSLQKF